MPEQKKEKKKSGSAKKTVLAAAGVVVLAGAGIYGGAAYYYHSHFFPHTIINGLNCAGLTPEQVKSKIQNRVVKYQLTLKERGGGTDTLSGDQIGLTYVDDHGTEDLLQNQNVYQWPLALIGQNSYNITANTTYDKEKVKELLAGFSCFNEEQTTAPTDAYIEDQGDSYEIVPETEGNRLETEKAEAAVVAALDESADVLDLEEADLYAKPEIYASDETLQQQKDHLNTIASAQITYDLGGKSYTAGRDQIKAWLVQDASGTYQVSEEQAAEWVHQMAYETDTFGLSHTFRTSLGKTITLEGGGDYGWCINKEETTKELLAAIEAGTVETREPVYLFRANDRSENDIGNTYVEVCISQQKMWCYKDGVLVTETPVTTGNHATGYDTPAGSVWAVDAKKKDYQFSLYDSHVMFWLPFNEDVGIHDADWRTEYGGDIYLTNGSHGCVNTPYDEAEKIFDAIEIGDPVIVYYSLDDVVGPKPTQQNTF